MNKISCLKAFMFAISVSMLFAFSSHGDGSIQIPLPNPSYKLELPPVSMGQFYPPKSKEPVYLYAMLGLDSKMNKFLKSIDEGKWETAQMDIDSFQAEYIKISKMVPEWSDRFNIQPISDLSKSITSGDKTKITSTLKPLFSVCWKCHMENRLPVWYKYHWGDFSSIKIKDKVDGKDIPWVQYMFTMADQYSEAELQIQEKNHEKAQESLKTLQSKLEILRSGCKTCHESDRAYFTSSDVIKIISDAALELKNGDKESKAIGYLQKAGMESCYKCHLVHIPAAAVQHAWARESKPKVEIK